MEFSSLILSTIPVVEPAVESRVTFSSVFQDYGDAGKQMRGATVRLVV